MRADSGYTTKYLFFVIFLLWEVDCSNSTKIVHNKFPTELKSDLLQDQTFGLKNNSDPLPSHSVVWTMVNICRYLGEHLEPKFCINLHIRYFIVKKFSNNTKEFHFFKYFFHFMKLQKPFTALFSSSETKHSYRWC